MNRTSGALLVSLALLSPLYGQDAAARLEAARARGEGDPTAGLRELEALLGSAELGPALREEAARARAGLLLRAGRREEGQAAWRALLARGDAAAPAALLGLLGARLEVELLDPPRPGAPARVRLAGSATGPLQLRLYALDLPRWRALAAREPERDLFARLRAPPADLLRGLATWEHPGFAAPGEDQSATPPLPAGAHLLLVEARGVPLATPLLVSPARGLARRGAGPGLLWLVDDRSGATLPGVELERFDARGRPLAPLSPSNQAGLARFDGPPGWALAWLPGEPGAGPAPALLALPDEAPPLAPAPPALQAELPALAPGVTWLALLAGLPPGRDLGWTFGPPALPALVAGRVGADAGGAALLALPLPPGAPAGTWTLALEGATPLALPVVAPPGGPVRLELEAPHDQALAPGEPVACAVRALLPDGRPLPGRRLRWTLLQHPAAPPPAPRAGGPLPPHARSLRALAPVALGAGELALDARGEARWVVPAPSLGEPGLVSLRVTLAEPDGLSAQAVRLLAWAPSVLHLELRPARPSAPAGQLVAVELAAFGPGGSPVPDLDLELLAEPEGGGPGERHTVRTGPAGTARAFVTPRQPGRWRLQARGQGAREARAELLVVEPGRGAPPAGEPRLVLEAEEGGRLELLALFPGQSDGPLLLLVEDQAPLLAEVLELRGGAARASLSPPRRPARALALCPRQGATLAARLDLCPPPAPLQVTARLVDWPGPDRVTLQVEARDGSGAPAPALVSAALFTAEAAGIAARLPTPAPVARARVRGDADEQPPGAPAREDARLLTDTLGWLEADTAAADASDGAARVTLRLDPRGGLHWARLRARARDGAQGEAWLPVRLAAPLLFELAGPEHLCSGDRGELRAAVLARELSTLPAGVTLRVAWSAEGVDLGRPRVGGARPLPGAATGASELVLEAAPRVELAFPLSTGRAGPARVSLTATLEGTAVPPVRAELELAALEPGWTAARCAAGQLLAQGPTRLALEAPRGAIPRTARLLLALDPDPATAVLAGWEALARAPGLEAGLAARWVERAGLTPLLRARGLRPRAAPPEAPPREPLLAALLAARAPDGGWGPRTAARVELFLELEAAGEAVPPGLLEPALACLPGDAAGEALRLRAGRAQLPPPEEAAALAGRPPGELLGLARALLARGEPARAAALRRAARARAGELHRPRDRAALLHQELTAGEPPDPAAVTSLLLTRAGPGWDDPLDAAPALVALAALAAAGPAPGGARLRLRFEDDDPHGAPLWQAWSGNGLAEWPGVLRLEGNRVAGRPTLRAESDAPGAWAARLEALVRPERLPARGLSLALALRTAPDGPPVPVAGVTPGETVWLEATLGAPDGRGLEGTLLELPLPGGCRLLRSLPGGALEGGVLRWEPERERVSLPLLALDPGDWSLPPARLRELADPAREAWSEPARLRIRP